MSDVGLVIKAGHVLLNLSTGQLVIPLTVAWNTILTAVPAEVLDKLDGTIEVSYVPKGAHHAD